MWLVNIINEPQLVRKSQHFCQAVLTFAPETTSDPTDTWQISTMLHDDTTRVIIDPDNILSTSEKMSFLQLTDEFADVFGSYLPGYSDPASPFEASLNMSPTQPPQRRGRLSQYSEDRLRALQLKFDEFESAGVFAKPESVGVAVEYVNPSFLLNKPNGGHRLVTAFSSVGRYSKPLSSAMQNINSTQRKISQWRWIIKTYLTSVLH